MENLALTPEEQAQFHILQQKYIASLIHDVKQIKENYLIMNNRLSIVEANQEKQVEKQSYRDDLINYDRANLTTLGKMHIPVIGSIYMGELLRKVGICLKQFGSTTPKSQYMKGKNPLVDVNVKAEYTSYVYHGKRTWKLIQSRLQEMGYLIGFEACKNTDEIHEFIKNMNYYN